MIAAVEGILERCDTGKVVVKVGGFSLELQVPTSNLERLAPAGRTVRLHTHLHMKEETAVLYGFLTDAELDLFKMLLSVTGIGPKGALNILSGAECNQLATGIASGDIGLLSKLPGVGKKTASRLVLELRGKLEREWTGLSPQSGDGAGELMEALMGLGYTATEAARAISSLPASPEISLEEKIRLALRQLAK